MKYCFLDLETTGFDPEKDSIIEVSFIVQDTRGQEEGRFDEVVQPTRSELSPIVTSITGITQEEIDTKGKTWTGLKGDIATLLQNTVIIGHNIDFDIRFLIGHGIDVSENPRIDTHELARIALLDEESYALEVLSEKYGFTHTSAHRAMSDVEANVELFRFLEKRIDQLPSIFLEAVRPVLKEKTGWYAKTLFLEATGGALVPQREESSPPSGASLPDVSGILAEWNEKETVFVRQTDALSSAEMLQALAQAQEGATVILTKRRDFFPGVPQCPIPEVLLDKDRLEAFAQERQTFSDQEITFYLQCLYRHICGYRGLDQFNLFFNQRKLWDEICMQEVSQPAFQDILREKLEQKVVLTSPKAFLRLRGEGWFEGWSLVIDEAEDAGADLLFASSREVSLLPYLEQEDQETSVKAQFFITQFCREILEEQLQHKISPFPEKILLEKGACFGEFATLLQKMSSDPSIKEISEILRAPDDQIVRWAVYYPETGNLVFGWWYPEQWRAQKALLGAHKKVLFYRHTPQQGTNFFQIFLGISEQHFIEAPAKPLPKFRVAEGVPSVKSPEFNTFTKDFLLQEIREAEEGSWIAANFSSLETLRKLYGELSEALAEEAVTVFGERVSGGQGKMQELLKQAEGKVLFLHQKTCSPDIAKMPFRKVIVQKFPFSPPHPLLEAVEQAIKASPQSMQSFWNLWMIPQVTSNLTSRLSVFSQGEEIILLDSRENAAWGKEVLERAGFR